MIDDYTISVTAVSSVFFVLCSLAFILRISHRRVRQWCFIMDDGLVVFAFCVLVAQYAIIIKLVDLGIGRRSVEVAGSRENVLILRYVLKIIGQLVIALSKLSIAINCLEFSKLNNGIHYQRFAKGVCFVQICFIGSVVPFLVPCYPISRFWHDAVTNMSVTSVPGCVNITTLYTVMKVIGFVDDIFLLAVPIPIIARLPKRLAIQSGTFLFTLGFIVILLDAIRLAFQHNLIIDLRTRSGTTFDDTMVTFICTWLKQYIVFIVACMPKARVTVMDMLYRQSKTDLLTGVSGTPVRQITSEMSEGDEIAYRFGQTGLKHADDSKETIVEYSHTNKQSPSMTLPWHSFKGNLEAGLESDRHNWLDTTKANAYQARHSSVVNNISPISPFHLRTGEWEELYPADEVHIKPFDSQFAIETTNVLPFGSGANPVVPTQQSEVVLCQATGELPEDRITGRSALQKAYYDQVQAMRKQNATLQASQTGQFTDDDTITPERPS